MTSIGYYVHHHGDGHRQRAIAIAKCDPSRFVLIGTGIAGRSQGIPYVDLPDDRLDEKFAGLDAEDDRPHSLHYAPLGHAGIRDRAGLLAQWISAQKPSLLVVDVSVEISMLARLLATPSVYVRLCGNRSDTAHLDAFRSAKCILSPYQAELDDNNVPSWVREKTAFIEGITSTVKSRLSVEANRILIVCGRGGTSFDLGAISRAAAALPEFSWRVIGIQEDGIGRDNLTVTAWCDSPEDEYAQADVVVGSAGDGTVAAVLATKKPFICLPEKRPFNEQTRKAESLERLKMAVVIRQWPEPDEWSGLIAKARSVASASRRCRGDGAQEAASMLIAVADGAR